MVRCDACGAEVLDGEVCLEDHSLLDPMLVMPAGGPAHDEGRIRLRAVDGEVAGLSSHLMSEALTALADAQTPVTPSPDAGAPALPNLPAGVDDEPDASLEQVEPPAESPDAAPAPAMPVSVTPSAAVELFGKPTGEAKRTRRALLVPVIVALIVATVGYVVLRPDAADAATYRIAFTPGETHRYAFRLNFDGDVGAAGHREPVKMSMAMDMTERVASVGAGGVATIRQRIDRATVRMAGETVRIPRTTITMKLMPDGRVLGVRGTGGLGCSGADPSTRFIGPSQLYPAFPSDAVAPGDRWTVVQRYPNPLTGEVFSVTTRNRLVSVGDAGMALIRSDITMPMEMDLKMADVARTVGRACGGTADVDPTVLPASGSVSYDGAMTMQLTQTVERATGRPVSVTGTGALDLAMAFDGPWSNGAEVTMKLAIDVSFVERRAARDDVRPA